MHTPQLGRVYLRQNKLEQAYNIFVDLEKDFYINNQLYNEMGLVSLKLRNFLRAQREFEKGLSLYPNDPYLVLNLGFALLYQNKYIEAERQFRRAILLDESISDAHAGLGFLYLYLKKYNKAEKEFIKAYRYNKKSIRAVAGLGHLFYEQEKYRLAEEKFKEAITIDEHVLDMYSSLEQVSIERGNSVEAEFWNKTAQKLKYQLEDATEYGRVKK